MVRGARDVLERAWPSATVVADAPILDAPHRVTGIGECLLERGHVRDRVLRQKAAAVNEQHDRMRPRALWQAEVPELQWTQPIRDAVIRWRGVQRGDTVEGEWLLSRRRHGQARGGQREE